MQQLNQISDKIKACKIKDTEQIINGLRKGCIDKSKLIKNTIKSLNKVIIPCLSFDILLMIDGTISMKEYIKEFQNQFKGYLSVLADGDKKARIFVGCLVYRDFEDDYKYESHYYEKLDFTENLTTVDEFVSNINFDGGLDEPEDVNGAMHQIFSFSWQNEYRIIIHLTDAPCHGKGYHSYEINDFYEDAEHEISHTPYKQIFKDLILLNIKYILISCINTTDIMSSRFEKIWTEIIRKDKLVPLECAVSSIIKIEAAFHSFYLKLDESKIKKIFQDLNKNEMGEESKMLSTVTVTYGFSKRYGW